MPEVKRRDQTWDTLAEVLDSIRYARDPLPEGYPRFRLHRDDEGNWARLDIFTYNPNTYRPGEMRLTRHEFIVPAATYHNAGWTRWVFDRIASIEMHETCESFQVRDEFGCDVDCKCSWCGHAATLHDGRNSTCRGAADCAEHRFHCETGHYVRIYGPHHSNGWDPYTIWYDGHPEEQAKAPGDD